MTRLRKRKERKIKKYRSKTINHLFFPSLSTGIRRGHFVEFFHRFLVNVKRLLSMDMNTVELQCGEGGEERGWEGKRGEREGDVSSSSSTSSSSSSSSPSDQSPSTIDKRTGSQYWDDILNPSGSITLSNCRNLSHCTPFQPNLTPNKPFLLFSFFPGYTNSLLPLGLFVFLRFYQWSLFSYVFYF